MIFLANLYPMKGKGNLQFGNGDANLLNVLFTSIIEIGNRRIKQNCPAKNIAGQFLSGLFKTKGFPDPA